MAFPDRLPRPEVHREITPGNTGPVAIDRPLDQQSVVAHRPAHRTLHRRQDRLDLGPHLIAQHHCSAHVPSIKPKPRSTLETRPRCVPAIAVRGSTWIEPVGRLPPHLPTLD